MRNDYLANRLIVAIAGMPGAGKHTLQEIVRNKTKSSLVVARTVIEEEMRGKSIHTTDYDLSEYTRQLQSSLGTDIVARRCMPILAACKPGIILLDGVSNYAEVNVLREAYTSVHRGHKHFLLVAIQASPEKRFEHLKARGVLGLTNRREEFARMDKAALDSGIGSVIAVADYALLNDSTEKRFMRAGERFVLDVLHPRYKCIMFEWLAKVGV